MTPPRHLVVIGAAAGLGRWLCRHLFSSMPWESVTLIDTARSVDLLRLQDWEFDREPALGTISEVAASLGQPGTAVCLAVPNAEVDAVAAEVVPHLHRDAVLFDTASSKQDSLAAMHRHADCRPVFGTHPLFSAQLRSLDGQTVVITATNGSDDAAAYQWFADAVASAGGIVKLEDPEHHDQIMAFVETMSQQVLLSFADALTSSGFDLDTELWANRTPLFETLVGLATNVLAESQQTHVRSRQTTSDAPRVREVLRTSVDSPMANDIDGYIETIRDRFSGSLFDTIQATASAAIAAAQAKKADLSRHARTGELVGIVPIERPDTLRVGHIVELSSTAVTLEETMLGEAGSAAMIVGPGAQNAARLGIRGKTRRTSFGLGRIDVASGAELSDRLDDWLSYVRRDVRFLVPESIAGSGVLSVVAEQPRLRNCQVVSEVVRTGQRAVVIGLEVRADHDVDQMVELLRERVSVSYAWPQGLSLPVSDGKPRTVSYLGPQGTFSESAALQTLGYLGFDASNAIAVGSFPEVIDAASNGGLGVVPVASSASGLVERTAAALLDAPAHLSASGVIDVAVRFDAFVPAGVSLNDLRGAEVLSHPQALEQCTRFIARWGLVPVPCASTAEACLRAAEAGNKVALGRADLSVPPQLRVAEREVDDIAGALTRFLVIGHEDDFGTLVGGSDPTLRSVWIAADHSELGAVINSNGPAFDEIITSPTGRVLLVTSREATAASTATLRYLGRIPWTPRTPLVRLGGTLKVDHHAGLRP